MSLSTQVLISLALGIITGVIIGERAAALQIVGDAFIMLMQMTVMPFIAVSLISAVGKLERSEAVELGLRAGGFLLLIWAIVLVLVVMVPAAFPPIEASSFFSSSLVAEREPFDFLALYIPSNPVYVLAHNVVPAVVLFSAVMGVALIGLEGKEGLIRGLDTLASALTRMSGFVARLAPLGVFALIASAAGTIALDELQRLQVFLITYLVLAVVLTFWILPGLVSVLTPLTWKEVVPPFRGAIVTAFAAGNLLIVIPLLAAVASEIAASRARDPSRAESAVDVIVPASFNFPSAGKLLSLTFLPFAAWMMGAMIPASDYPQLLLTGLFTFFALTSIAIPVLLDFLRLPADLFELFIAIDVITGRFQIMVACMSTIVLALLGAFAMSGSLQLQPLRLVRFAGASMGAVVVLLLGARLAFSNLLDLDSQAYGQFIAMEPAWQSVASTHVDEEPPPPMLPLEGPRLARIDADQLLRVCYLPDSLPMAFVNAQARLVGFDIDLAHDLARELGVELELVRVERSRLAVHLAGGTCDIAMSGFTPTAGRSREFAFADSYLDLTLAFISEDHVRQRFVSWSSLRDWKDLHLAAPAIPRFLDMVARRLPNAKVTPIDSNRVFFRAEPGTFDGLLFAAEPGSAWTMVYPRFTVTVPDPGRVKIPLAYAMPLGQPELVAYVNTWLETERLAGTLDQLFEHWILGRAARERARRWSVLDDVLGWNAASTPSEETAAAESE